MNKSFLAFLMFALIGCSHFEKSQHVVQFPYAPELLEKIQVSQTRSPASTPFEWDEKSQKSPRRVYFGALYHQYVTIAQHLNKNPDVESCPQFHHDKIEAEALMVPKVSLYRAASIETEGKDYFPELAFNKNFSLRDYHVNLKSEIAVLCEEGVSDNYYKFDNLVTHYANKKSFHLNPTAMASVLKIPVFANYYLVKMLQGNVLPGFSSPEEGRIIELTQTHWFEKYVAEASKMRSNFIKNKMVQR